MTDKVEFSFKLSNLVDRISGTSTEMTGKGKSGKGPKGSSQERGGRAGEGSPQPVVPQPGTAPPPSGGKPANSRQFMENFLQSAATPTKRNREEVEEESLAKRAAQGDEDVFSEGEEEWQSEMRGTIEKEVGLTEEQVTKVMNIVMRAFRLRVVHEAKKVAMQTIYDDQDTRRSYNSIIVHRADQWVDKAVGDGLSEVNLTLAERVTVGIHQLTAGAVAVLDAYALGRWDSPTPVTAVLVTFGSRTQKSTFFKILARKSGVDSRLKAISCRDAFPKKLVKDAKALADKGSSLRNSGSIASFRVVARGTGCIPVLEVKGWLGEGYKEARWRVYAGEEPLPQREGGARTRSLTKTGTVPSTPLRPAGINRLSVSGPEGEMDIVRLDITDEQICTEEY